jgi:hypothetical protein
MKHVPVLAICGVLACSKAQGPSPSANVPGIDDGMCEYGGLIDSDHYEFACFDRDKHLHIRKGYDQDKAAQEMLKREDNAWNQLGSMTDTLDVLVREVHNANNGKAEINKSLRLSSIKYVTISKTADSSKIVLAFTGLNGQRESLWLDGTNLESKEPIPVRAVTPY